MTRASKNFSGSRESKARRAQGLAVASERMESVILTADEVAGRVNQVQSSHPQGSSRTFSGTVIGDTELWRVNRLDRLACGRNDTTGVDVRYYAELRSIACLVEGIPLTVNQPLRNL